MSPVRPRGGGRTRERNESDVRLFALIFGLSLAVAQIIFIDAYLRWLGAGWPLAPLIAILLVGLPVAVELYGDELRNRFPLLAPVMAQTRSALWQVANAILVFAGALMGYDWQWWQAALLLVVILMLPQLAAEFIRRVG
jgi:hypothetical protein